MCNNSEKQGTDYLKYFFIFFKRSNETFYVIKINRA